MNAPAPATRCYGFADLTLDLGQCCVRRGDDVIALSKLSFELLRVLAENAPNVVPHDELARQVWGPRRVVTPENLTKRVMLLRQALDDHATHSGYIEGLRGRGYRLIPPVHADGPQSSGAADSAAAPSSASRRKVIVGTLAIAVGAFAIDDYRLRRAHRETVRVSSSEQPRTFELYAPPSSSFGASPTDPQPALAPGGRELAFVAPFRSTTLIWAQALDGLDARPLHGTEWACFPFWSADGRSIAFAAGRSLKRISAAGGVAPTEIVAVDDTCFFGGVWTDDDTVLYSGPLGLYRIAARDGGRPVLWTRLDATAGEFSARFPVLLPDGRRFVYLALATQAERQGFYIGSLDDRGMKKWLAPGQAKAVLAFGADGRLYLLFVGVHGELLAQPFDASHTRLTDEAVEVAPPYSVEVNGGACAAAFAASHRVLVYRPRVSNRTRVVSRDRNGAHSEIIPLPDGAYRRLALSHDGTMLTVERDALDEASGLWLIDRRRNQNRRLGEGQVSAWTRDDSRIVYSNAQPDGWHIEMRTVAADAEAEPLLAGGHPFMKRICDVTRNELLFQGGEPGDSGLYRWPFASHEPPRTLPVAGQRPNHARVSSDERWLAFAASDAGEMHVYVTSFPDLRHTVRVSTLQGTDPQWRTDGRELYYVTLDRTLMAINVTAGDTLELALPVPLFHMPLEPRWSAFGSAYAPAPGGQRFVAAEVWDLEEPRLRVTVNWNAGTSPAAHAPA